ncbi:MAG TPA: sulfur carrier protein ThiS adenylyltransferase ThiF [Candidatus Krumholzibacteria bacterium]|nr:sulfur carrier protein ThiS adenylyltransferase ThiF [Candidatus Krumholzibacteria bacterium]HPD70265.1 sulfur carrier protein ThiS adenylyltransferase ThiF [Candidatus Krumholzibacteria bacterium]HRY40035.1 sulfur carrier protein ThiS adenylyltransferase ThiF [Candidatus Krumholzibacteria bacterium]
MDIFARNVPGSTALLQRRTVAVAGCGGLGSNVAVALARAGVGHLILIDHDVVAPDNLNRQHFFRDDVGRPKVAALADHLRRIQPAIGLDLRERTLQPADVAALGAADLLVEAFDRAEAKRWLLEAWCREFPERWVIAASGLAGIGRSEEIRVRRSGRIIMCGDFASDQTEGLCAARVLLVAAMQANVAIECLVEEP